MSHNLWLHSGIKPYVTCSLWQTPTKVTDEALASKSPKDVYFRWLDSLGTKMKGEDLSWHKTIIASHKRDVLRFLRKHGCHKWHRS